MKTLSKYSTALVAICYALMILVVLRLVLTSGLYWAADFITGQYPGLTWLTNDVRHLRYLTYCPYIFGGLTTTPLQFHHPIMFILAMLFPATHQSIILIGVHLVLAGIGMYLFLRNHLEKWPAWFGGVSYMMTGMIVSLISAGHDGKIMVSSYIPWLLWCIDGMTLAHKWKWAILAGIVGGLAANTAHIQLCYYMVVFCAIYAAFRINRRAILLILAACALAVVLYMPLYLSFKKNLAVSTRATGRNYATAITYSMPPEELPCTYEPWLFGKFPQYTGQRGIKSHTEYVGFLVFIFGLAGLFVKSRLRWPMLVIGVTALVISLGGYTPIYKLIYKIPPNGIFRGPGMAFIGCSLAFCCLAATFANRFKWWIVFLIGAFTFFDLAAVDKSFIIPITFEQAYGDTQDVADYISQDKGDYRVWIMDGDINDSRWMLWRIKSMGGNYPMPRAAFCDSVGIQPGKILPDYHHFYENPGLLRTMNVRYLVSSEMGLRTYPQILARVFVGRKYAVYRVQ